MGSAATSDLPDVPDVLRRIMVVKAEEIAAAKANRDEAELLSRAKDTAPPASFLDALYPHDEIRIIAEAKKASPSAGVIREPFEPVEIARSYAEGGAACVSVLTDERFFQGSLDDLAAVSAAVDLPTLRKEFVLDPIQVYEARLAGASAVLLIAECLSADQLADLAGVITEFGMTPLVELHDPENLAKTLACGARLIGVNNRNLRTFQTDIRHTLDLLPHLPEDRIVVTESGLRTGEQLAELRDAGVRAALIGETFLRAPDPGNAVAEMLRAARKPR